MGLRPLNRGFDVLGRSPQARRDTWVERTDPPSTLTWMHGIGGDDEGTQCTAAAGPTPTVDPPLPYAPILYRGGT